MSSTPKQSRCLSMNALTSSGLRRARSRKRRGGSKISFALRSSATSRFSALISSRSSLLGDPGLGRDRPPPAARASAASPRRPISAATCGTGRPDWIAPAHRDRSLLGILPRTWHRTGDFLLEAENLVSSLRQNQDSSQSQHLLQTSALIADSCCTSSPHSPHLHQRSTCPTATTRRPPLPPTAPATPLPDQPDPGRPTRTPRNQTQRSGSRTPNQP